MVGFIKEQEAQNLGTLLGDFLLRPGRLGSSGRLKLSAFRASGLKVGFLHFKP